MNDTTGVADGPVGLGLLGTGRFGRFCLAQYLGMPEVRVLALADANPAAAAEAAAPHGLPAVPIEAMLADPAVQLVYLGTPPATHLELTRQALAAGKHVLVEKPLATTVEAGEELVALARAQGRVLAVHHILRYDPVCRAVAGILAGGLLGAPLHASFENLANDEVLPDDHWFWDKARSGGIFVEHAVHFFDLFAMWFGPGEVVAAQQVQRPGGAVDQVACTARYGPGVHTAMYHGFHQPGRMDRQELRIVCERGSIRLWEWVPIGLELDCLADEASLAALESLVPNASVEGLAAYEGSGRLALARHKSLEADGRYRIRGDVGMAKWDLYAIVIRDLLADVVAAIRDPSHERRVTEQDALAALRMGVRAEALAVDATWIGP